jgi:hypothetical protein
MPDRSTIPTRTHRELTMKTFKRSTAGAVLGLLCLQPRVGLAADEAAPLNEPKAAAEVERAREHFNQGLKLYRDGDFSAALVQFERAYSAKPNYKVLYNIAQTCFQLRDYVEARNAMRRYLSEGGLDIDADRREQATQDLVDLERRIGTIRLSVNVDGASVFVDGKRVGTTPLRDPIAVSEGQRTISVEEPSRGARQRLVRLAGSEELALTLDFEAPRAPLVAATAPRAPRSEVQGLGAGFWVSALSAVALGAGAGVTGYLTLRAQDENEDERNKLGASKSALESSRDDAKSLALTTDILAGAAIVCAGVATVVLLTTPSRTERSTVELSLRMGPQSAALRGRF